MSKRNANPRTIKEAEQVLGYHCAEVQEMAIDIAQRMVRDQNEWLDGVMKDLLPPDLYEAGKSFKVGEDNPREPEIAAYAIKHGIQVVFIPDSQSIRVMLHGKVHAQFIRNLTVDGEPVSMTPKSPLDSAQN